MKISLRTRVTVFIALVVVAISLASTYLFISAHKKNMEKEIVARGITMAESLSMAVDEGLAEENLEFIKQVSRIVHTKDVSLAQVYTTVWLAVDAYPYDKIEMPPDPAAVEHFKENTGPFYRRHERSFDFYSPVFYHRSDAKRDGKSVIGYVRLSLSSEEIRRSIKEAVTENIIISALLTLGVLIVLNVLAGKYVVRPILNLHESVSRYARGEFPETIPVYRRDEMGDLSSEFNRMCLELKEREEALRESESKFKTLAEQALIGICLIQEGRFCYVNPKFAEIFGYSADECLHGMTYHNVIAPGDLPMVDEHMGRRLSGESGCVNGELRGIKKNGDIADLEVYCSVTTFNKNPALIWTLSDITERKQALEEKTKLEEQFRQAQKMEAVGQLAGGVAHDFNNILTGIIGYEELLGMHMKDNDPLQSYLRPIRELAEKAAHLTHSLLAFSRKQVIELKPVDINSIVFSFQKIMARIIGEDIDVKVNLSGQDLIVTADAGQIEQVLMNLSTNARDAMPGGGVLTIGTEKVDVDDRFVQVNQFGETGSYAVISVADTGSGMDEETKQHIFEPFFTTKEVGKGTGLGLAMVYGTVRQHNGFITVYSERRLGTTFKLYLPLVMQGKEGGEETDLIASIPSGSEVVLLVEDDVTVRNVTRTMLEEYGYTVIEAVDGEDAVRLFRENARSIQLVLSDMIMPKKHGRQVYEEVRQLRPEIKILLMSGYAMNIMGQQGVPEGVHFISKPATPAALLKKIRQVLDFQ